MIVNCNGVSRFVGGLFMKRRTNHDGYFTVNLSKGGRYRTLRVHRLVAKTFIANPLRKPFINHKDGRKKNCCVTNLEWATRAENEKHALKNGLKATGDALSTSRSGELNPLAALTRLKVAVIRKLRPTRTLESLAKQFRVSVTTVWRVCKNMSYKIQ